jgi:hypothetical protein
MVFCELVALQEESEKPSTLAGRTATSSPWGLLSMSAVAIPSSLVSNLTDDWSPERRDNRRGLYYSCAFTATNGRGRIVEDRMQQV